VKYMKIFMLGGHRRLAGRLADAFYPKGQHQSEGLALIFTASGVWFVFVPKVDCSFEFVGGFTPYLVVWRILTEITRFAAIFSMSLTLRANIEQQERWDAGALFIVGILLLAVFHRPARQNKDRRCVALLSDRR